MADLVVLRIWIQVFRRTDPLVAESYDSPCPERDFNSTVLLEVP